MAKKTDQLYGKLCSLYYDLKEKYACIAEIDFYSTFIKNGNRTLEAMSGSGRLQIPLLKLGYEVDGVDSSLDMLKRCRQRCELVQLTPLLYQQKLEELSLEHTYNLILIVMGSFQLIADKKSALQALHRLHDHMYTGSTLLIDIFTPDNTQDTNRSTDIIRIDSNRAIHVSKRYIFHEQKQQVDALCSYELIVDGMVEKREHELMHFAWYTDAEFIELLRQAGFEYRATHEKFFQAHRLSRIIQATAL
jgi:ubiquinone/menaquinone biosynthesis C-methylase UbiE